MQINHNCFSKCTNGEVVVIIFPLPFEVLLFFLLFESLLLIIRLFLIVCIRLFLYCVYNAFEIFFNVIKVHAHPMKVCSYISLAFSTVHCGIVVVGCVVNQVYFINTSQNIRRKTFGGNIFGQHLKSRQFFLDLLYFLGPFSEILQISAD